eukprot:g72975.t1
MTWWGKNPALSLDLYISKMVALLCSNIVCLAQRSNPSPKRVASLTSSPTPSEPRKVSIHTASLLGMEIERRPVYFPTPTHPQGAKLPLGRWGLLPFLKRS